MSEDSRQDVSVVAAVRPEGDVVAVAWGQYSDEGVFAAVSTDGGYTFDREERIAQHAAPQNDQGVREGCCGAGWNPTLAYEPSSQSLVAVWAEEKEFIAEDADDPAATAVGK